MEVNGWANNDFVLRLDTVYPSNALPLYYPFIDSAFPLILPALIPILSLTSNSQVPSLKISEELMKHQQHGLVVMSSRARRPSASRGIITAL